LENYALDDKKMDELLFASSLPELNREIEATFPELDRVNCIIRAARYPDYTLYRSVRGLYDEYIVRQHMVLRPNVISNAEDNMGSRLRIDELEKYGEILTRYPILLQFLALEKGFNLQMPSGE
jgi:hypothetical protein